MIDLTITLTTAAVLGLIFIWLSARVIGSRVANEVLIGEGDNQELLFRIRAQANFTEYVPIFVLILGGLEVMGGNATVLSVLAVVFVLARLSHVPGMKPDANLRLRQAGIIGSFTCIGAAAVYALYIALLA